MDGIRKFASIVAVAAMCAVACEKPQDNGYDGTNYIELSSSVSSVYDKGHAQVDVNVSLTSTLDEDLELVFAVKEDKDNILALKGNPVIIKAGEKFGSFSVEVENELPDNKPFIEFVISLASETVLPEKVILSEGLKITVKSAEVVDLTEEQKSIVEKYKASTGIDLSAYLGLVDVSVTLEECDFETGEYTEPETFVTSTIIQLSDTSTEDCPVLKMVSNPMGINDKIYDLLRNVTVKSEFWIGESAGPEYKVLMEGINWNEKSVETFEMSLDGISLNSDKTIAFTGKRKDSYGDDITVVPFDFYFSAYEREKNAELDITEGSDATSNPEIHLNTGDISYDTYELEGEGLWVKPEASISEKELKFIFCFDYAAASDYIKVVATYTPNK